MAHELTYTRPPRDIFDVLHAAEAAGVELPEVVDKWWKDETLKTIRVQEQERHLNKQKREDSN